MAKEIQLTQGKVAIVDDADYEWLSQWKWSINTKGYAARKPATGHVRMHRLIIGAPAHLQVDHINGDKLDNRRANLRLATNSQNGMNRAKRAGSTATYKGVRWEARRPAVPWRARIMINGRSIELGYHATEIEAARAYDRAARQYFGEFARLNFPNEEAA